MRGDLDGGRERLNKTLAAAGVAARRSCDKLIQAGRVTVNGEVVTSPGTRVDPEHDELRVGGNLVRAAHARVYLAMNKPVGVTCTLADRHADTTIADLLGDTPYRLYPVGRLDVDTDGLILLTNDGDFAHRMTHPRFHVPKLYRVETTGRVQPETIRRLRTGIVLGDGMTAPAEVRVVRYQRDRNISVIEIRLFEGRKRQVRRMLRAAGHPVRRLTRTGFGNVRLDRLRPGGLRALGSDEIQGLLELCRPRD